MKEGESADPFKSKMDAMMVLWLWWYYTDIPKLVLSHLAHWWWYYHAMKTVTLYILLQILNAGHGRSKNLHQEASSNFLKLVFDIIIDI